jgi:hypothetical protein
MSVLETPRIYFRGHMAWDPITTNNYPDRYDEQVSETLFTEAQNVQSFRQQAIADVRPEVGNWNPQGTHRSSLYDSAISGADLGSGCVTADPFVGAPASFVGMLVDCEPYGAFSSQLFFDTMTFGVDGGYRIFLPRTERVTARYINFFRYTDRSTAMIAGIASVNWQTAFPKGAGLRIEPYDSPALQALAAAMEQPDVGGLVVRWNAYRTAYYDGPDLSKGSPAYAEAAAALIRKLESGGWQPNPARSFIVGAIGLWRPHEPVHEPVGRALLSAYPSNTPPMGSAHARLADNVLTVDLSNSISETGPDLQKQALGPLHFVALAADGTVMPLATMTEAEYGRDAYLRTSGIVTLPVDAAAAAAAADADIQLRGDNGQGGYDDTVYLAETALRAIPTQPNLYIDEQQNVTTNVQVFDRGVPAGAGVQVSMVGAPSATVLSVAKTDAKGVATLAYQGPVYGAVEGFVLLPGDNPALPSSIDPQVTTYMYIRSLSLDDTIGELAPSWENVYTHVLAKWHALAPCMDNWLDLGSEAQVKAYAPVLARLTDPAAFENFRYMPVTRDMTQGERILLYNFLGVTPPAPPLRAALASEAAEAAPSRPTTIDALSKAMRTG